jgi:hypothetical protein
MGAPQDQCIASDIKDFAYEMMLAKMPAKQAVQVMELDEVIAGQRCGRVTTSASAEAL